MSVTVLHGDCLDVLATLPAESVHSVVTDPPYHLTSIVKRFGAENAAPAKVGKTGAYARASAGFMGKQWDGGDIAFRPETWAAVSRVMKPGAHLLAFGGTRGFHRMFCAIEDAGFEVRDCISWLYGSGFPKSHNIGDGWGTAIKPAWEPVCVARKSLSEKTVAANVLKHGTGGINVDACRVGVRERPKVTDPKRTSNTYGRIDSPGGKLLPDSRWPANVIHDGSDEVVGAFPCTASRQDVSVKKSSAAEHEGNKGAAYGRESRPEGSVMTSYGDEGSAARFFYSAKADAGDRLGSKHPTVKPVDLMRWLVRLVTPKGGVVLDPFAGSGTTGMACMAEGFDAILIEREAEYVADIKRRIGHVGGADTPLFADV